MGHLVLSVIYTQSNRIRRLCEVLFFSTWRRELKKASLQAWINVEKIDNSSIVTRTKWMREASVAIATPSIEMCWTSQKSMLPTFAQSLSTVMKCLSNSPWHAEIASVWRDLLLVQFHSWTSTMEQALWYSEVFTMDLFQSLHHWVWKFFLRINDKPPRNWDLLSVSPKINPSISTSPDFLVGWKVVNSSL